MSKKLQALMSAVLIFTGSLWSQEAPLAEPVYGGYVEELYATPLTSSTTRVYATTMSANSMFYTDIDSADTTPLFSSWTAVPDLDWDDDYGELRAFAADAHSGFVFAGLQTGGVIAASPTAGSLYTVDFPMIEAIQARNGHLFYQVKEGGDQKMYYAPINASGVVGTISSVTIASAMWSPRFAVQIVISPFDQHVYVFVPEGSPILYKSSDIYSAFSTSTTFSLVPTTDLTSTGYEYNAFNVAPDGRLFAASFEGYGGPDGDYEMRMSYSDDDGVSWTTNLLSEEGGRGDMRISGDSTDYRVYYSRIVSDDKGVTWSMHGGADGAIAADPNNKETAYVRTDWAMGMYDHTSATVDEINDGMLAVQVNDFAMDTSKSTAWVASKSGIWYVENYGTGSVTWTEPIWPDYDSTPYDVVSCTQAADTAYMGNSSGNVFRYEAAFGDVDDPMSYERIFETHNDGSFPYWTWTYGSRISAIAIDETYDSERVIIGVYDDEDWDETEDSLGGVFVGTPGSPSWNWTQITGGDIPDEGIDVLDMVVVEESGNTVAYVGVEYNTTYGTVSGVFRCEESSGSWSASRDLYLDASYPIAATINDLYVSDLDTIYACGTDASGTTVRAYKKAVGDTYWESLTSDGLVYPNAARAFTVDEASNDLYMAIDNVIYVFWNGAAEWEVYYEYPNGTDIQFIYYDDLLVGTGVGLYGHDAATDVKPVQSIAPADFVLQQNYPNPFNPSTQIQFSLAQSEKVELRVFDMLGQEVAVLVDEVKPAGMYEAQFEAASLSSGLYFYRLTTSTGSFTKKMMLLK